jgi:hypothetical protein
VDQQYLLLAAAADLEIARNDLNRVKRLVDPRLCEAIRDKSTPELLPAQLWEMAQHGIRWTGLSRGQARRHVDGVARGLADGRYRIAQSAHRQLVEMWKRDPDLQRRVREFEADLTVVAAGLGIGVSALRFWFAYGGPGRLRALVRRERRRAELGPGYSRRIKGLETPLAPEATDPSKAPDEVVASSLLLQSIKNAASRVQWRAVMRLRTGRSLSNADRNALFHLRRKLQSLGLSKDQTAS